LRRMRVDTLGRGRQGGATQARRRRSRNETRLHLPPRHRGPARAEGEVKDARDRGANLLALRSNDDRYLRYTGLPLGPVPSRGVEAGRGRIVGRIQVGVVVLLERQL